MDSRNGNNIELTQRVYGQQHSTAASRFETNNNANNVIYASTTFYTSKVYLLILLILADSIANVGFDYTTSQAALITYFTLQVIIHCTLLLAAFLLSWSTFLQRFGLLGLAFRDAWPVLLAGALRFCTLLAVRIPRMISAFEDLEDTGSLPLTIHSMLSVLMYTAVCRYAVRVGRAMYYCPRVWVESSTGGRL